MQANDKCVTVSHWVICLFYLTNDGWVKSGEADTEEEANNWCHGFKGERMWQALKRNNHE